MRTLVVTADDFGLTERISMGILRAHANGIVTSVSALAVGPAFPRTVSWLKDHEALGVGVHLAVVGEDRPLLSRCEIPTLVDSDGRFKLSWRTFVPQVVRRRVDPDDVRRECAAQIDAVRAANIRITHLDSHQHLHLLPIMRDVVLALAKGRGIAVVRVPRSHGWTAAGVAMNYLARRLTEQLSAAGLRGPDDFAGFDEAGRMDRGTFISALDGLARRGGRTVEISTHPGETADTGRYAWGYAWDAELATLTDSRMREDVAARGFRLGTYDAVGGDHVGVGAP